MGVAEVVVGRVRSPDNPVASFPLRPIATRKSGPRCQTVVGSVVCRRSVFQKLY